MRRFKAFSVIIHLAGWVLFMAFPLLFLNGGRQNQSGDWLVILQTPAYWLFCFTYIFLFYINAYIFIPRFLLRKRYVDYAIVVLVLLSCVYFLKPYGRLLRSSEQQTNISGQYRGGPPSSFDRPPDGNDPRGNWPPPNDGRWQRPDARNGRWPGGPRRGLRHIDSTSLFLFLMIMALSAAIKTVQQWQLTEQRATQAEADKASAELSFLKAQINPHFLFNTLNNIYSLAVTNSQYTADSIMKLSNIMRYVTDEVTADFVTLQSEIDCISDYIELQRLRLGKNATVNFTVTGDANQKKIPPLVMMTFVENVFKYGISKHTPALIDINIAVDENQIRFFCQNQVFSARGENTRTGIGIKNTTQRLNYLYPGKHFLDITNDGQLYTVLLTLET